MPTINISGSTATSEASKTGSVDRANRDPNYVGGAEALLRRSARDVLKKQSLWDKKVEEAERADFQFNARFEVRRRQQLEKELRQDSQDQSRWRRMHDAAERDNLKFDKRQQQRKQTTIDKFNARFTRQQEQQATLQYRFMRADADAMNRAFDKSRRLNSYGAGLGGMGGYGAGLGSFGHGAQTLPGRLAYGAAERMLGAASFDGVGGMAAGAGGLALAALGATWEAPAAYAKLLGDAVSGATPYYNMTSSAARLGRGGGTRAQGLIDGIFSKGAAAPKWMSDYGLSPQGALDWASETGIPVSSATQLRSMDTLIGAASTSIGLGGLGTSKIAQMMGLYNTVSGSRNVPGTVGNFDGSGGAMMGQESDFLRKLGGITQYAMTKGINASTVASGISSMLTGMATNGAVGITAGNATSFYGKMLAGGNAWMRTGQGIASASAAASSFSDSAGYGANSSRTLASLFEVRKLNHGKLPTTMAQLAKVYGFDPSNLSPADRRQAEMALQAARSGDALGFTTLTAGMAAASPQFALNASSDYAASLGLKPYQSDIVASALFGGDTSAKSQAFISSWATGKNTKIHDGSLGYAGVPSGYRAMIDAASKRTGLPGSVIAGMIQQESSFNPGAANSRSSARGLTQMTRGALDQLHKNGIDRDISYSDLFSADKSIRAGSDYLAYSTKAEGGNVAMGLAAYKGGLGKPDLGYAQQVEQSSVAFSANPEARQNRAKSELAQAHMVRGYQESLIAAGLSNGPVADGFQSADQAAMALANGLQDLTGAVKRLLGAISAGSHSPSAGIHGTNGRHVPRAP